MYRKEFQPNFSSFNDSVFPSKDISSHEYGLPSRISNRSDCAQLNINSVRNKFDSLVNIKNNNIEILIISEAKLNPSFPVRKFLIHGFSEPYKLGRKSNGVGILLYIRKEIPLKLIDTKMTVEGFFVEVYLRRKGEL